MTPRATLNPMGLGVWTGRVEGHPAADTSVQITRLTHDTRRIRLFNGSYQVGEGVLTLVDGVYRGRCTEYAGEWHCEARAGSPEIVFREHAPADVGAA